jgi:hypothetical protein
VKPKVFISHTDQASLDKRFTDRVVREFKKHEIPYWIDREHPFSVKSKRGRKGPAPENPLFGHLCESIAECDLLLFILSRKSVRREFCRLEFDPRVLYGPAAHILKNRTAIMVALNNLGAAEITLVLGILCGRSNVIDMSGKSFSHFWRRFRDAYRNATVVEKDDGWRRDPKFQKPKAPRKPTSQKRRRLAMKGKRLFKQALEKAAEGRLDFARELLGDAYNSLHEAGDVATVAQVLHETFLVELRLALGVLTHKRVVHKLGDIVVRDSHIEAFEDIRYALECLEGSMKAFAAAGQTDRAIETVKLIRRTEGALKSMGIDDIKGMTAYFRAGQTRSILEMLKPPDES